MILFIGQIARHMREREAFQEVDYKLFFGGMAKWVVEVDDPARLPELISRAFRVAMQGRPGPVVVALPEDVLTEKAAVADAARVDPVEIWPGPSQIAALHALVTTAKQPLVLLGGSRWTDEARRNIVAWSERFDLPVATSFRRAPLFPPEHPNYAGDLGIGPNPKLANRVKDADLLIMVGARLSEMPSSSYSLWRSRRRGRNSSTFSRPPKNLDEFTSQHWPFKRPPARLRPLSLTFLTPPLLSPPMPPRLMRNIWSGRKHQDSFQAPFSMAR